MLEVSHNLSDEETSRVSWIDVIDFIWFEFKFNNYLKIKMKANSLKRLVKFNRSAFSTQAASQ